MTRPTSTQLITCLLLAGCQSDAPESTPPSESDRAVAAETTRAADSAPASPPKETRQETSAKKSEKAEEAKQPQISPSSPAEAVDIWYRALNTKDRALLNAVLLRRAGGFQFTGPDSVAHEIEETEVFDTDEELAKNEGVERGDVLVLTKTRNARTGETKHGHFILLRETKDGWRITGYVTRQNMPEELG